MAESGRRLASRLPLASSGSKRSLGGYAHVRQCYRGDTRLLRAGCFTTAYYLIRLRTGKDIRDLSSGNVGARNAGRVIGKVGGTITFLGDAEL